MALHELHPAPGSRKDRKRRGRGNGSGRGNYSGRGMKGQKSRENIDPYFEGGQLKLVKRMPWMRGFHNRWGVTYEPINLRQLEKFGANAEVTPQTLVENAVLNRPRSRVKLLGDGDVDRPLQVRVHAVSKSAREKIEAAGGSVTVIE